MFGEAGFNPRPTLAGRASRKGGPKGVPRGAFQSSPDPCGPGVANALSFAVKTISFNPRPTLAGRASL